MDAVKCTEVTIVAVGTPYSEGKIDLSQIKQSVREIGDILKNKDKYHVVCIKSTVVPTTTDTVVKNILEEASGKKAGRFGLAMNPEFLREGKAVEDFMNPDRIVIGAYDKKSFNTVKRIYKDQFKAPIIRVNLRTAEMIKYASNGLLAALISYSNEVASICEETGGIDVKEVLEGVTLDKRFSPRVGDLLINPEMTTYLMAGCGFGGSCFPKDVKALVSFADNRGYSAEMLKSILKINETQPLRLVSRLETAVGGLQGKKVAVLGVAFKPDTDDVRESPALIIIKELLNKMATVVVVDPIAVENADKVIPANASSLCYSSDYKYALQDADAAILATSWPEFSAIPAQEFVMLMKNPVLVDGRRVYDKQAMEAAEVEYIGVGLAEFLP
jgi:UDPglucose 6-dehydrogenase/GDP-mannose 6-dehydrogenase